MAEVFWTPTDEEIRSANVTLFRETINKRYNLDLKDYWELHRWSTGTPEEINQFWTALWDFGHVIGDKGPAPLFDASRPIYDTSKTMENARVNWAENMLLSHPQARSDKHVALVACIEPDGSATSEDPLSGSHIRQLTWAQLYTEVAQAAATLRKLGVGPGDRVAAYVCNNAEAVVFLLATSSLGAIWSSCSPEFGVPAVLDRFVQLQPKVLLAVDRYRAAGKVHDVSAKVAEIASELVKHGLAQVIMVGQLEKDRRITSELPRIDGVDFLKYPDCLEAEVTEIEFWRGSGNAPLWVLYSSGTTGKPKAIIHNQLGMTLVMKLAYLHNNFRIRPAEVHLQATNTGWMMYNQMVNSLCLGMTIVLYDGNPILRNNRSILFDFVDRYNVTSLAISPRYLQLLYQDGVKPKDTHKLDSLRSMFSAGSPLKAELYHYIRDHIKDVFIHNGTGGTDLCCVFVGAIPVLPIRAGTIQGPYLGYAVEACAEDGSPVQSGLGDLVIAKPAPNMPCGFLGDDANQTRFKDAYFNHYPNRSVWYHADYIEIESDGGVVMHGRSDGVLNPQGVRFGSAELYAIIERLQDDVEDCIAVGQKMPDADERVLLFVKPKADRTVDDGMRERIGRAISSQLSRRHVPAKMIECPSIPHTVTGKKLEVAVKKIVNGARVDTLSTAGMANPEALDFFVKFQNTA